MRFDAVIFDMDGVLIDSEPLHYCVANRVLSVDGLSGMDRQEYERFLGTTVEAMFEALNAQYHLRRSLAEFVAHYDQALLLALEEPREPADGVKPLIARLRALGLQLAVASSSRRAWVDATLRSIGLWTAFDTVVSGDDVQHGKPDPEIYLLAAGRLGVRPERCLAIEDSPNGVQSARSAGMAVLGVRTEYTAHLHLDGVERTVDSLAELDLSGDVFG
jgi:HAD superfamily hydrolase (TIGR01509 family)